MRTGPAGRLAAGLTALAGALADVVHPPTCSICSDLLDRPRPVVCPACRFGFDDIQTPVCSRCGQTTQGKDLCPDCRRQPLAVDPVRSAFDFGGPVAEAIQQLKLAGRRELADYLADELVLCRLPGWNPGTFDLLVPVPLHRSRLVRRGFNQAALLAKRLSKHLGIPFDPRGLRRTLAGPPQGRLTSRRDRAQNVSRAFRAPRPDRVAGRSICLVDDVVTTGATLDACARVLLEAGATKVAGWTVARTPLQ